MEFGFDLLPSDATYRRREEFNVTITNSNPDIVEIEQYTNPGFTGGFKVRGLKQGTAVITGTTTNGLSAQITFTVKNTQVPVQTIEFSASTLNVKKGESVSITASISPDDATNKSLIWTSSNTDVATVVDGTVVGVGTGSAVITATSESNPNVSASATVTVTETDNAIILNKASLTLEGTIGVNYYLRIPEEQVNDTVIRIVFNGNEKTIVASEAPADSDGRQFQYYVSAKNMRDKMLVFAEDKKGNRKSLKVDGGSIDYKDTGYSYSVKDYLDSCQDSRLEKAMDNYGMLAQKYFKYGDYESLTPESRIQ